MERVPYFRRFVYTARMVVSTSGEVVVSYRQQCHSHVSPFVLLHPRHGCRSLIGISRRTLAGYTASVCISMHLRFLTVEFKSAKHPDDPAAEGLRQVCEQTARCRVSQWSLSGPTYTNNTHYVYSEIHFATRVHIFLIFEKHILK